MLRVSTTKIVLLTASAICLTMGQAQASHASDDTQVEANKKLAQQYFSELIEKEDPSYVEKLFHPEAQLQFGPSWKSSVTGNNKISGMSALKKHYADIHASKDISSETIDIVGEGDTVAIYRMTHESFPDGRKADIPWMSFFKFKNGKIISVHHLYDSLSQQQQHNESKSKTGADITSPP